MKKKNLILVSGIVASLSSASANGLKIKSRISYDLRPGQLVVLPGGTKSMSYEQIAELIRMAHNLNHEKTSVTIHSENKKIDLSFLDDVVVRVTIGNEAGAPPNVFADGN